MRITVWENGRVIASIDPTKFSTEVEFLNALNVQRYPDQEYSVQVEDNGNVKNFYFDGADGLHIIGVLCYRGLVDLVFSLAISATDTADRFWLVDEAVPENEVFYRK